MTRRRRAARGPDDPDTSSGSPPDPEARRLRAAPRSPLTDDDAAVWSHAASTLEPLRRTKARVHPAIEDGGPDVVFAPRAGVARRPKREGTDPVTDTGPATAARTGGAHRPAPELQPFEVKRARRLRAGRIEIEARIDLHGMKQAEAHAALRRFLVACQADGRRMVLVITGKGGGPDGGRDGEGRDGAGQGWDPGRARGVLKRNVPRWLEEPDLRRIVVSYAPAAQRHGGEGAIYVHLRSAPL